GPAGGCRCGRDLNPERRAQDTLSAYRRVDAGEWHGRHARACWRHCPAGGYSRSQIEWDRRGVLARDIDRGHRQFYSIECTSLEYWRVLTRGVEDARLSRISFHQEER